MNTKTNTEGQYRLINPDVSTTLQVGSQVLNGVIQVDVSIITFSIKSLFVPPNQFQQGRRKSK